MAGNTSTINPTVWVAIDVAKTKHQVRVFIKLCQPKIIAVPTLGVHRSRFASEKR